MPRRSSHAPRLTRHRARRVLGMTLPEMIIVIVITGIVASVVSVFILRPVQGYTDAARRAELTDIADTALRRITRDLRTALPNSVRTTTSGNVRYIEYLQTRGGGRYRADKDSGGAGTPLDFTAAITDFDVIGTMPALASGDAIVIYNLTSDSAVPTGNAYAGDNRETYASNTATTITLGAAKQFPFASPGKRFQIVQHPVTYACDPLPAGTGQLRRYWGYAIAAVQPTPPAGGSNALLATDVTDCSFAYDPATGASGRTGVVSMILQVEQSSEKVRLFQQVHVSNVP